MSDALPAERRPAHRPALPFEVRIPTEFTNRLLELVADGKSLNEAVELLGRQFSRPAVLAWAKENEKFGDRLRRARELGRQAWADEQTEIADTAKDDDTAKVKKAELRIRTRQWLLERLEPEMFSPRHMVDHKHTHTHELGADSQATLDRILRRIEDNRAQVIDGEAHEVEALPEPDGDE